jgi:hypothetical protein
MRPLMKNPTNIKTGMERYERLLDAGHGISHKSHLKH